jgi:hypothetical protein
MWRYHTIFYLATEEYLMNLLHLSFLKDQLIALDRVQIVYRLDYIIKLDDTQSLILICEFNIVQYVL